MRPPNPGGRRGTPFQRALICEDCYQTLERGGGMGAIARDGEARRYSLSKDSRRGHAAVYDHARWREYRRRKAQELGANLA